MMLVLAIFLQNNDNCLSGNYSRAEYFQLQCGACGTANVKESPYPKHSNADSLIRMTHEYLTFAEHSLKFLLPVGPAFPTQGS